MSTRLTLVCVALLALSAGCTGTLGADGSGSAADVQVSSIGQSPVDNGTAVEVSLTARNYGTAATTSTSATITLLDGSETVAERTVSLGDLGVDESASISVTLDADPEQVDGRRVTFD
jgi:hypothetical protein